MSVKLGIGMSEVPEFLKAYCTEADGVVTLDESKLHTQAEIESTLGAKANEKKEHAATKAKLAEAQGQIQKIVEKYGSVDEAFEAADELENLRKGGGASQEELAELRKLKKKLTRERDDFKTKYESQADRIRALDARELKDLKYSLFEKMKFDPKFKRSALKDVFDDIADSLDVDKTDPEHPEFKEFRGKKVEDYLTSRGDMWKLYEENRGGGGKPGAGEPLVSGKNGDYVDEIASKLL